MNAGISYIDGKLRQVIHMSESLMYIVDEDYKKPVKSFLSEKQKQVLRARYPNILVEPGKETDTQKRQTERED